MCANLWLIPHLGLSPRVRGNRSPTIVPIPAAGSIPACAGEPPWRGLWGVFVWVYPRVCGGTYLPGFGALHPNGLSPRVRGNLVAGATKLPHCGSIPACAGEPDLALPGERIGLVYPRVCGGTPWLSTRIPILRILAKGCCLVVLDEVDPVCVHDVLGRLA